jgi:hypothetical protein
MVGAAGTLWPSSSSRSFWCLRWRWSSRSAPPADRFGAITSRPHRRRQPRRQRRALRPPRGTPESRERRSKPARPATLLNPLVRRCVSACCPDRNQQRPGSGGHPLGHLHEGISASHAWRHTLRRRLAEARSWPPDVAMSHYIRRDDAAAVACASLTAATPRSGLHEWKREVAEGSAGRNSSKGRLTSVGDGVAAVPVFPLTLVSSTRGEATVAAPVLHSQLMPRPLIDSLCWYFGTVI